MSAGLPSPKKDVSIVLCGQAGQGVQTVESLLTRILARAGHHVFATKEYMSRVRGGANSTQIRVSGRRVSTAVSRIDLLAGLNKGAIEHVSARISAQTVVLAEPQVVADSAKNIQATFLEVPFTQIASEIGNNIYLNTVAAGAIAGILGVPLDIVTGYVREHFAAKSNEVVEGNVRAAEAGYRNGRKLAESGRVSLGLAKGGGVKGELLLSGAEAVGLGAIAGGCNLISSYPMSPSTAVLVFLAKHGRDFGVIAEQAEDEIAAINMAIGAWYAGARAMATTSGGGFALMTEGVSLAGMLETPVVVHVAQRPGPATGLPTRTEQADLELVLYAGHGEFPRAIFAPGTVQEAFCLTQKAFNLADRCQVPVFVLTDQYLVDSYYNVPRLDVSDVRVENCFVETAADYRRYALTVDGVSPRGVPGFGRGLVAVDSDEHDQEGHITEDLELRANMVDKRLRKLELLKQCVVPPTLVGPEGYRNLVVCWGSTFHAVREALTELGRDDTAMLHFGQVYPLHAGTAEYLGRARRTIIVEGNATSQLGKLIKLATGIDIERRILKYSGLQFTVEQLVRQVGGLLD